MEQDVNLAISERLREARADRGWTLEQLAQASHVSRAMISKIERGEVSPTATVLGRLASGLGIGMSALFGRTEPTPVSALQRQQGQAIWRDPATGYVRRHVSPRGLGAAMEIVEVSLPPGERVMFDNCAPLPLAQFVWLLEGALEMTVSGETTHLLPGDCLHMRLDQPIAFHNPGQAPARYAVVIETGARPR